MARKLAKFLISTLAALLLLGGCAQKAGAGGLSAGLGCGTLVPCGHTQKIVETGIAGKIYLYEKGGFGGPFFTITLRNDGSFRYHEGWLSSYIGSGDWELDGDTVTIRDEGGMGIFNFRVEGGDLVYIAEGSSRFLHVNVPDGGRFSPDDGTENIPGSNSFLAAGSLS